MLNCMKKSILLLLVLCITILFSCSNSVSEGDKFIGTWKRIPPDRAAAALETMGPDFMTKIAIKKDGELFLVKEGPMSKGFGPGESVFELKEGKLIGVDGFFYYLKSSGHLKSAEDEWEKISNNTW